MKNFKIHLFFNLKSFFEKKSVSLFLSFLTIILIIIHLIDFKTEDILNFQVFLDIITFIFYLFLFFIKSKNKISLRNKIFSEVSKYLLYLYIFGITFYVSFYHNYFHTSIFNLSLKVLDYGVLLVLILFLINLILGLALKKHIFDRFEIIQNDIEEIKYGNISKRITIFGVDEVDRTFYFVNDLLEELDKKIEFEKKFSLIDPLTKCFNRRGLDLNFKAIKSNSLREKRNISMMMVDLDNFKHVNDTYGHDVGDDVLVEFSNLIKDTIRPTDSIYRLGGEEFLIVMPELSELNSNIVVKRLNESVKEVMKIKVPKIKEKISFSGGFVNSKNFDLNDLKVLDKMIKKSDDLMYKAKTSGKDKIEYD